jgi:NADPH:quinone reductase-like Zn-dependent oxidoreductase
MNSSFITVPRLGGPEVLALDSAEVRPAPHEAVVRVTAAGVSYGDVLLRVGVIPGGPKPPFVPGFDAVGEVEQVGAEVTGLRTGQRVVALLHSGGYAERVAVPADRLVPVPDGLDPVQVAAAALNYFIAYQMLHRVAKVRKGTRLLVHGAAGGVGTAVLQLARLAGVESYGTCSTAKLQVVRDLGGHPIDYRGEDFVATMKALPEPGVDVVLDPVGATHFWRSYRVLRRGGILIAYGQSAALRDGRADKLAGAVGFLGGIMLPKLVPDRRSTLFYNAWSLEKSQPRAYRDDLTAICELLAAGEIKPVVDRTLPLREAAEAHALLERSAVVGKIVLLPGRGEPR